jgi:hypothetical protein
MTHPGTTGSHGHHQPARQCTRAFRAAWRTEQEDAYVGRCGVDLSLGLALCWFPACGREALLSILLGVVTDAKGAVVPSALVALLNENT